MEKKSLPIYFFSTKVRMKGKIKKSRLSQRGFHETLRLLVFYID